jgi:hypothetical protein
MVDHNQIDIRHAPDENRIRENIVFRGERKEVQREYLHRQISRVNQPQVPI